MRNLWPQMRPNIGNADKDSANSKNCDSSDAYWLRHSEFRVVNAHCSLHSQSDFRT